jgi:hypothetical protein
MPMMDDAGAVLAAGPNADQSQSQPAPTPDSGAQGVPPAPDLSNAPLNTRQAPPAPPVNPVAASVMHHATFGAAVKSILGSLNGRQTVYAPNPQTGQIEEQSVPVKPGAWARNLMAGFLIGGAAGSESGAGGFAGGFARGGRAVLQNQQQNDQRNFERAQQQMKNQQEAAKIADDHVYHQALTAHENIQTASILHNMHAADEETVARHNASARAYEQTLTDAGALSAKLFINGKAVDTTDGNSFVAAFNKDPSILHAGADGFERHFISTADLTELHYDGEHWVDDSGNPVNMGDNIHIKAYDLPTNSFKSYRSVSGAELNKIRGAQIFDGNKTYQVTPEGVSSLYTLGTKEAAENARTSATQARANHALRQQADNAKLISDIENKRAAAFERANRDYQRASELGDENAKTNLDQARQDAQTAYANSMTAVQARGGTQTPKGNGSNPQARPRPQSAPSQSPAPEGTRIRVGNQIQEKRNGQWVVIQGQ